MYQLIRGRSFKSIWFTALPPLAVAFVIAEMYYKFHSFTLECLGFLATWFVLDFLWTRIVGSKSSGTDAAAPS